MDTTRLGGDTYQQGINRNISVPGYCGKEKKKGGGEPVANAVISLEKTDKKAVSELTGYYRLVEVGAGWYCMVVMVEGVQMTRVLHKVEQGKVERMDFEI